MEAEPWCLSSALFFQERALNTKNESLTAPSSKGLHPLQGDKQEINLTSVTWQYTITFTEG